MNDFFLVACLEDFIENARLFIFETFCRIHQCISIRYKTGKGSRQLLSSAGAASWFLLPTTLLIDHNHSTVSGPPDTPSPESPKVQQSGSDPVVLRGILENPEASGEAST